MMITYSFFVPYRVIVNCISFGLLTLGMIDPFLLYPPKAHATGERGRVFRCLSKWGVFLLEGCCTEGAEIIVVLMIAYVWRCCLQYLWDLWTLWTLVAIHWCRFELWWSVPCLPEDTRDTWVSQEPAQIVCKNCILIAGIVQEHAPSPKKKGGRLGVTVISLDSMAAWRYSWCSLMIFIHG